MGKKEANTDLWVHDLLKAEDIHLDPQGSTIKEINEALKTASKSGKGNPGRPEYCGVVGDFIVVIEDKPTLSRHILLNEKGILDMSPDAVRYYAVNGAYHYALHLVQKTSWKKVFAIAVSGDEKRHRITPIFVNERGDKLELPDVETFISFSPKNIENYYHKEVLKEKSAQEKQSIEIIKDARQLHEDLRTYGSIKDQDKPLIVSGILLALREIEHKNFLIENLNGDPKKTDGEKIYDAIESNLKRANVSPETKRDKLLSQFAVIKDTAKINTVEPTLKKTPLRHYTEFLYEHLFKCVKLNSSAEDYLGLFYGEFMSYSGGDGQSLGIVLTPKHITTLFCDLLDLKMNDIVLDPCCGTGGFLIAAMHHMLSQTTDQEQQNSIRKDQLFGYELQPYMFTIATTNMILRGDGKSNLNPWDFLKQNPNELQLKQFTVGMMNPPYSQGTKADPSQYEINFIKHLLDCMVEGGRVAVIVPQSSMTGKTQEEQEIKTSILESHTLEGVITLNKETFYRVGTNPCIAIFKAHCKHSPNHICKFINFEDDGYEVIKHLGLVENTSARDKRQHLLDVWRGVSKAPSSYCVNTTVKANDEWLHAYYYFEDEIPQRTVFENTMADYLSFEMNILAHGKGFIFDKKGENDTKGKISKELNYNLTDREWKVFDIIDVFPEEDIKRGKRLKKADHIEGNTPYVSSTAQYNGIDGFIGNTRKVRKFEDCLTLANSGSVGSTFYHSYSFIASDHVTRLKKNGLDKYAYLFMCPIINRLSKKYSFNREINDDRIKREKIILPTNKKEEIDFQFMSDFMKDIEREIILKMKNYFKEKQSN